jgi:hypothetical protein
MKILFSMRHFGFVRMYETVLRDLADRGHTVVVAGEQRQAPGTLRNVEELAKAHPSIEWSHALTPTHDLWYDLARVVRLWLDYLRFFRPEYDAAPKLRARAEEQMPRAIVETTARAPFRWPAGRRLLQRILGAIERAIPSNAGVDRFLMEQRPDVVLLTPLVYLGSAQVEVLKSAKALGLRTGLCVGSWDHLSSKAFIRDLPDRVFVWNDTQKREAVDLHGVPAARVVVTGAQCYDHWFDRRPSRSREAFCASVGLPADRPFILYVCSALFLGSPSEAEFVSEWAQRVRADEDPALRDAPILIRPHPARSDDWARVDLSDMPNVAVTPPANPVDEATRGDYFDALHYSHAVVGLNTSAFLEAGLLGKPVFSLLLPRRPDCYAPHEASTPTWRTCVPSWQAPRRLTATRASSNRSSGRVAASRRQPRSSSRPCRRWAISCLRPLRRPARLPASSVSRSTRLRACRGGSFRQRSSCSRPTA